MVDTWQGIYIYIERDVTIKTVLKEILRYINGYKYIYTKGKNKYWARKVINWGYTVSFSCSGWRTFCPVLTFYQRPENVIIKYNAQYKSLEMLPSLKD